MEVFLEECQRYQPYGKTQSRINISSLHPQFEKSLLSQGYNFIAGVDEVGRGPLAGPVTAAAVVLDCNHYPEYLNDSKKLNGSQRERVFEAILATSYVSIAHVPAQTIDKINIRQASLLAMRLALSGLPTLPDYALIDGRDVPFINPPYPCQAIVKGDQSIASIAAASIVAKVMRDRLMKKMADHYPVYGFEHHAGYGTKKHLLALSERGPCLLHRLSFKPVQACS